MAQRDEFYQLLLASEAHIINGYNNLKRNFLKCYENMYCNQLCLKKKVISNYAKIKLQKNLPATKFTQQEV